jgi:integrase
MANTKVSLLRKCKTVEGWRYYPVAMSANGKVKPNKVLIDGVEHMFPVGHYVLRSYAGSKTVWTRVKGGSTEANDALRRASKRANAVAVAEDAGIQVIADPQRKLLRKEWSNFVLAAMDRESFESAENYARTLNDWLYCCCTKTYADELIQEDITKHHRYLRARGASPRTVRNRHMYLRSFLLYLGLDAKALCGKAPKVDKTLPEIFEREPLARFFASLTTDYDRLLYNLLLQTGLRDKEARHLEWVDISYAQCTLKVVSKPRYKHKIKDAEERELPLTGELVAMLQAYGSQLPPSYRLVFGRDKGKRDAPNSSMLYNLKILAREAGVLCGTCEQCFAGTGCERWFLHKFRATYCTTLLRDGMDIVTVQKMMGHSDLASTLRYVRPAEASLVRERMNTITWY